MTTWYVGLDETGKFDLFDKKLKSFVCGVVVALDHKQLYKLYKKLAERQKKKIAAGKGTYPLLRELHYFDNKKIDSLPLCLFVHIETIALSYHALKTYGLEQQNTGRMNNEWEKFEEHLKQLTAKSSGFSSYIMDLGGLEMIKQYVYEQQLESLSRLLSLIHKIGLLFFLFV